MKDFKIKEVKFPWWGIFPYIFTLTTWLHIGYSVTNVRKYYLNRKLLLKLLKKSKINLVKKIPKIKNIDEYIFKYKSKKYIIWHHTNSNKIALGEFGNNRISDLIGLFDEDVISRWQVKQIVNYFNFEYEYNEFESEYNEDISENFFKNLEEFKNFKEELSINLKKQENYG